MKIKMLRTVRPDYPCLSIAKPGTILYAGVEYEATANQYGGICGVCENGVKMGLKPGEFVFVSAPAWIIEIWLKSSYPSACAGAVESDEGETQDAKARQFI